jgi:hypothetical protein
MLVPEPCSIFEQGVLRAILQHHAAAGKLSVNRVVRFFPL